MSKARSPRSDCSITVGTRTWDIGHLRRRRTRNRLVARPQRASPIADAQPRCCRYPDGMSEPGIHRHLELDVDLDELWQLVTDPDELATWLGDEVELDPVPGGAGRLVDDDVERHVRVDH